MKQTLEAALDELHHGDVPDENGWHILTALERQAHVATIRTELTRLRADAVRLDWLEAQGSVAFGEDGAEHDLGGWRLFNSIDVGRALGPIGHTKRAAIDAARAATPEGGSHG